MMSMWSLIGRMPAPIRAIAALLTGASLLSAIYILASGNTGAVKILMIGTVIVCMLLGLYWWILRLVKRRRKATFEKQIGNNADSSRREDLRRRFLEGVEKFRRAGKDLYELPWYVLVGESASGKTEAIRHSQLRFPPGMQDKFQGAGGTMDMHWWFTDEAVLLDTAGRLIEEGDGLSAMQWEDFLKMLRIYRRNCPVNGLILVIPADKLISSSADQLEERASMIARQLTVLQERLDIRFPVYVLITKCDLINGFREFFEQIRDPDLQHQILGWSNPDSIDDPFRPEMLEKHFEKVLDSVRQRRFALMQDPRPLERDGARIDDMDALYDYPESLQKIVPRIRRYLESVFGGGTWNTKPLFLRGIYFTSAMREGSALDEELAQALGVPVASLPQGKAWEKERSFFLHDVFREKIFRERGLVTKSTNTRKQHRMRRVLVLAAGFITVGLLGGLTWYWAQEFNKSMGLHSAVWDLAAREQLWQTKRWAADPNDPAGPPKGTYFNPVVMVEYEGSVDYDYSNGTVGELAGKDVASAGVYRRIADLADKTIELPGLFKAAAIKTDFNALRGDARRVLAENGIVAPLVDATRGKLVAERETGLSPSGQEALEQLLAIELAELNLQRVMAERKAGLSVAPLFAYVLGKDTGSEPWNRFAADPESETFVATVDRLLAGDSPAEMTWLPLGTELEDGQLVKNLPLQVGIDRLLATYCDEKQFLERTETFKILDQVRQLIAECDTLETELLTLGPRLGGAQARAAIPKMSVADSDRLLMEWQTKLAEYDGKSRDLDTLLETLDAGVLTLKEVYLKTVELSFKDTTSSLLDVLPVRREVFESLAKTASPVAEGLADRVAAGARGVEAGDLDKLKTPRKPTAKELRDAAVKARSRGEDGSAAALRELKALRFTPAQRRFLQWLAERVQSAGERVKSGMLARAVEFDALDTRYMGLAGGQRLYSLRRQMYQAVAEAPPQLEQIAALSTSAEGGFLVPEARNLAQGICLLRMAKDTHGELMKGIDQLPKSAAAIGQLAAKDAPAKRIAVPFTSLATRDLDPQYSPEPMRAIFARWDAFRKKLQTENLLVVAEDELRSAYTDREREYDRFFDQYEQYWLVQAPSLLAVDGLPVWEDAQVQLRAVPAWHASTGISDFCQAMESALAVLKEIRGGTLGAAGEAMLRKVISSKESVANTGLQSQCRDIRAAWTGLGQDALRARQMVLALKPSIFVDQYLLIAAQQQNPDFNNAYWQALSEAMLEQLSVAVRNVSLEAVEKLQAMKRFPLMPPVRGAAPLAQADLARTRVLIDQAFPGVDRHEPGTIGAGEPTGVPAVDAKLKVIGLPQVNPDDRRWLEAASSILKVLDATGREDLECTVSMPTFATINEHVTEETNGHNVWRSLRVTSGDETFAPVRPAPREMTIGTVKVVGSPVMFDFIRLAGELEQHQQLSVAGPWACLRLLFANPDGDVVGDGKTIRWDQAASVDGGETWLCTFRLQDTEGRQRLFLLKLKFNRALPKLRDWPGSTPQ